MKQEYLLIIFSLMSTLVMNSINAQVKIGDNPKNVNLHALLELESKDQGLLLPRLTQAQRDTAFGIDVPEEYGGMGIDDFRYNTILIEER